MRQVGISLLEKGLVFIRTGASRHRFQHSKKEVPTPEESHPPEQEVRSRETARDSSRATAHDRGRATARDRNRATAHDRSRARAHDRDRPHEAIDHTKEGFEATRGAFESTRSIQSYRHWKQEGVQFEK